MAVSTMNLFCWPTTVEGRQNMFRFTVILYQYQYQAQETANGQNARVQALREIRRRMNRIGVNASYLLTPIPIFTVPSTVSMLKLPEEYMRSCPPRRWARGHCTKLRARPEGTGQNFGPECPLRQNCGARALCGATSSSLDLQLPGELRPRRTIAANHAVSQMAVCSTMTACLRKPSAGNRAQKHQDRHP